MSLYRVVLDVSETDTHLVEMSGGSWAHVPPTDNKLIYLYPTGTTTTTLAPTTTTTTSLQSTTTTTTLPPTTTTTTSLIPTTTTTTLPPTTTTTTTISIITFSFSSECVNGEGRITINNFANAEFGNYERSDTTYSTYSAAINSTFVPVTSSYTYLNVPNGIRWFALRDADNISNVDANGTSISCVSTTTTTISGTTTTTTTTIVPITTTTTTVLITTTTTTLSPITTTTTTLPPTTTTTTSSPTTTTTTTYISDCGTPQTYSGGQSYPTSNNINLGASIDNVSLLYDAQSVPDRFIVVFDSNIVIDTGFVSSSNIYNYGGSNRASFNSSLSGKTDPVTGKEYPFSDPSHAPDNYPYVTQIPSGYNCTSFYKNSSTSIALLKIYAPMGGTVWHATLNCPGSYCPTTTTTTTLANTTTTTSTTSTPTTTTTTTLQTIACDADVNYSGGYSPSAITYNINFGTSSGLYVLEYQNYGVPDKEDIYQLVSGTYYLKDSTITKVAVGSIMYDSYPIDRGPLRFIYNPSDGNTGKIEVLTNFGTEWYIKSNCPTISSLNTTYYLQNKNYSYYYMLNSNTSYKLTISVISGSTSLTTDYVIWPSNIIKPPGLPIVNSSTTTYPKDVTFNTSSATGVVIDIISLRSSGTYGTLSIVLVELPSTTTTTTTIVSYAVDVIYGNNIQNLCLDIGTSTTLYSPYYTTLEDSSPYYIDAELTTLVNDTVNYYKDSTGDYGQFDSNGTYFSSGSC